MGPAQPVVALFGYHVRRWLWRETAPAEPSLQFYRREVGQRLEYGGRIWLRSGLPVAFGGLALVHRSPAGGAVATPRLLLNGAPFFLPLVGGAVMLRRNRKREREQLELELAELQALEG